MKNSIIYKLQAPPTLRGTVKLPASKSISNRALIISALAAARQEQQTAVIMPKNLSDCDDTVVMVKALRDMPPVIDIGAAGTAMRFLTAYLAATEGEHVITGTQRMKHRPIGILVNALRQLGADIEYLGEEGFPPLHIRGRQLKGGMVEIPGNMSSQYVSAMLMIAPALENGLELRLKGNIISKPYIDLTLWMMREYGADADWTSGDTVMVRPQPYQLIDYSIENDWSSASYWYEAMSLTADEDAEIILPGLKDGSRQGDAAVRYIFSMLGVKTSFETIDGEQVVVLRKNNRSVPRLDYDFINSPDLVQTIVATCAAKGIPFHFRGLQTLKIKETDRIEALRKELMKVGVAIHVENTTDLVWNGERCTPTTEPIETYEDHRMALSFAPLALVWPGISIHRPKVVTKSYPHFWEEMERAGFSIEEIKDEEPAL
ncbi:MAG: 3-phosphoshikimate 1-carboxyvinyltransferase [Prevotella sp.]|nr:3-phosphoshikimate 1-carboxyvinyltransferase [Prevotella sp.]